MKPPVKACPDFLTSRGAMGRDLDPSIGLLLRAEAGDTVLGQGPNLWLLTEEFG